MSDTEVNVRFKVNDDGSIVLDKISQKMTQVESHTKQMGSSLGLIRLDSIINLGERAFRTGEQVYSMAKQAASGMSEIKRLAEVAGMNTDQFQKMAYAAKMGDVDVGTLTTGMKKLSVTMDEAGKGSGAASDLFDRIGVSVKDASGKTKSLDGIMGELADKFQSWEEGPRKIAIAVDLFGRSGERLIPHLNKGAAGIREFYQEAEKLGAVLSEKTLTQGEALEDQFKKAEAWYSSLVKKIVVYSYQAVQAMEAMRSEYQATVKAVATGGWPGLLKGGRPDLKEVEATGGEYLRLEAMHKKTEAPAIQASALTGAMEKNLEIEARLNSFYADDVEKFQTLNRLADERAKSGDIMEQLGVKTRLGAEKEIAAIQQKYKSLMGQGYSPEEMEKARVKLEQQLQALESKYKTESGWKATGEEGGWEEIPIVTGKEMKSGGFQGSGLRSTWGTDWRWKEGVQAWNNLVPKAGVGGDITGMVKSGIDELNRMQKAAEGITGPKTMMVDYTQVQSANEMVERLRANIDEISSKPIVLTIEQRVKSDNPIVMSEIEDRLVSRFENKQSRLGAIIRKEIDGVTHYGNE
jgi:hypothetical protein